MAYCPRLTTTRSMTGEEIILGPCLTVAQGISLISIRKMDVQLLTYTEAKLGCGYSSMGGEDGHSLLL